jgi:hypothetical protein
MGETFRRTHWACDSPDCSGVARRRTRVASREILFLGVGRVRKPTKCRGVSSDPLLQRIDSGIPRGSITCSRALVSRLGG